MKTLKLVIVLFSLSIGILNAQNIGMDYFRMGEYNLSKKYFEKEIAQNPAQANFYLGEIAFAQNKIDEAKAYYENGLAANPEYPLNEVGLAKLNLKTNQKEAEAALNAIQKKNKKNADVAIAIGYAYLSNGLKDLALKKVDDARGMNKKNPDVYILEGDVLLFAKDLGGAAGRYEMSIYFDPNYALGYVKGAVVYEKITPRSATDKLEAVIKIKPDYLLAYKYLGRIYTNTGFYPKAIEAFTTYFNFIHDDYSLDDILKYATALYFNKDYSGAEKVIEQGLAADPNNFVLTRLQMYSYANTQNFAAGLIIAPKFFAMNSNTKEYLGRDYEMYGKILKDAKQYEEAIAQYTKALSIDTNNIELYKEMANTASLKGENHRAADYFGSYMHRKGEEIEATDFYQLGRYLYSAGNIRSSADSAIILGLHADTNLLHKLSNNPKNYDSLMKNQQMFIRTTVNYCLVGADSCFNVVVDRAPDGYTGYLWRARTNALMDPESDKGLAKPYYEKTVEILSSKGELTKATTAMLIEAYSYLGYYYYLKNDKDNTLLYWNKVLELDPQNVNANAVLKEMAEKEKKK